MAYFKSLKTDTETVEKCLMAIQNAYSADLWLPSFLQKSREVGKLYEGMNVLLFWNTIKHENVDWQYIKIFENIAAYYYEDSRGRIIRIAEDERGLSKVFQMIGFSDDIENQLNGLHNEELYDNIERYINSRIDDDFDMSITEKIR
ncbi:MAG: hypothetical protein VZS44_09945 [Bacilli bacterium]|nr:hypothetical protein [Bacilli bacterium]